MRRDGPRATTAMPRGWVAAALLLLALRAGLRLVPERAGDDLIAWQAPVAGTLPARERPVLCYHAASWCQPCQKLDEDSFRDARLARLVNERFIPVRVIAPETGDLTPEAQALLERHRVRVYPTLVIERPRREPLRLEGYASRRRVTELLEQALSADP